jgi:hypothetical protein
MQSIGLKQDINTPAMAHGTNNQINAFERVILPRYHNAIWFDQYLPINEYCGASPDILINGCPADVKCPFHVDSFLEQINSVPTKYFQQIQCQMMACKADTGVLAFYLTRPEVWGADDWEEYPLPLEKRFKIFEFQKDEALHDLILQKVEEYEPKKQQVIKLLKDALIMDFEQFFYLQWEGNKLRLLKDCSNLFKLEQVIRVNDNFYYQIK